MAAKRPTKTAPRIDSERIVSDRRMRFNPIRNLSARTLTNKIDSFEIGYLGDLARLFAAVESRDENLQTVAPTRYENAARLTWDVLINEGEAENPEAHRHRAALLYFYNNLRATDVTSLNVQGGVSVLLRQTARAIGHQYVVHEKVWRPRDPVLKPGQKPGDVRAASGLTAEFRFVPLWFFENTTSKLRYLPINTATFGEEMLDAEWFVAVGRGLLLPSTINYLLQRQSLLDWAAFNKDFGKPLIDALTDAAKGSADWNAFRDDLAELFGAKALLHGRAAEVKFNKAEGTGQATYDALLNRLEQRLLRMWAGTDLATQSGDNKQVGSQLQQQTQSSILQSDARWLSEQCNVGIDRDVLRWWFGDDAAERPLAYFSLIVPEQQNIDAELNKDEKLIAWGGQIRLSNIAERYGRIIENGDDFATPPAAPPFGGPTGEPGQPGRQFGNEDMQVRFERAAHEMLARAASADLAPLRARIRAILEMQDGEAMRAAAAELQQDLPEILRVINAAPAAARALEKIIGATLASAMAEPPPRNA